MTITSIDDAIIEPEEDIIIEIESISSGSIHPINNDRQERKNNDLHHTLDGNKLKKVINSKQPTKLNLHIGPAQIGVIKNIMTIIIFNLLSIILSQLLLP